MRSSNAFRSRLFTLFHWSIIGQPDASVCIRGLFGRNF
jgi:hypothetical protein